MDTQTASLCRAEDIGGSVAPRSCAIAKAAVLDWGAKDRFARICCGAYIWVVSRSVLAGRKNPQCYDTTE
eukprot:scaffold2655_cov179-Amphora_coffeaeformis.AAC.7